MTDPAASQWTAEVEVTPRLAAELIWAHLCLGDAAVDLSIAYLGFTGQARADLLSGYGRPVGPRRELAARALAISLAASMAEYAASDGRPVLLRESLAGLRRAVTA
jgi:hypothetical protein